MKQLDLQLQFDRDQGGYVRQLLGMNSAAHLKDAADRVLRAFRWHDRSDDEVDLLFDVVLVFFADPGMLFFHEGALTWDGIVGAVASTWRYRRNRVREHRRDDPHVVVWGEGRFDRVPDRVARSPIGPKLSSHASLHDQAELQASDAAPGWRRPRGDLVSQICPRGLADRSDARQTARLVADELCRCARAWFPSGSRTSVDAFVQAVRHVVFGGQKLSEAARLARLNKATFRVHFWRLRMRFTTEFCEFAQGWCASARLAISADRFVAAVRTVVVEGHSTTEAAKAAGLDPLTFSETYDQLLEAYAAVLRACPPAAVATPLVVRPAPPRAN